MASCQLERRVEERTAELKHSETQFKDFAEAASDWFWEMDADLRFTHVADRFFEIFRVRPEAVIGKTRKELAGETEIAVDPEKWRRHFDDLEAHRPIRDFTYAITGDDGEQRYLIRHKIEHHSRIVRFHPQRSAPPRRSAGGQLRGWIALSVSTAE